MKPLTHEGEGEAMNEEPKHTFFSALLRVLWCVLAHRRYCHACGVVWKGEKP